MQVVPEFNEKNIVDDDYPRPEYFDTYVGGDSGFDDNTAILFAYYDFLKDELVIEDEYVTSGKTTSEIINNCKLKELELWGTQKPYKRVLDADKQQIYDIHSDHGYIILPPHKDQRLASIHEFRIRVQKAKVKIKRRCANVIRQLRVGMWKDERHSDFQRSEGLGHLDCIAAAIYLNRSIDTSHNPVPQYPGASAYTHFIPPHTGSLGVTEDTFKNVFGLKGK